MTAVEERPTQTPERRPGELGPVELLRWTWRQLTSMRTALVLLLLLALAAVPGSLIPQEGVDSLKTSNWKAAHPHLTPIYEKLGLFSAYDAPWFAAIYILLMISLVGCIVPRLFVYAKALRREPPAAPRNLTRLPDSRTYETDLSPEEVLDRARAQLGRRHRLRAPRAGEEGAVSAERGYLREAGNLVFHTAVIVVLVGFAWGRLWGYEGGVILVQGSTFANTATQYDDLNPGSLFKASDLDPFQMTLGDFQSQFAVTGAAAGTFSQFSQPITYTAEPGVAPQTYDLRVNHPLTIDHTEVFLIGHGYAPDITVRDGEGNVTYSGPTVFLPQNQQFLSFGVVKAPFAKPQQIGLQGLLYPTFQMVDGNPTTLYGKDDNPLLSMSVYTGDLGLESGAPQSVYALDLDKATQVMKPDGTGPYRLDLKVGETKTLPDGLGSVTFNQVTPWVKLQISQSPGKRVALGGVCVALLGLLGSLFIRPRRVWVRARREDRGGRSVTMVDVAALDRSGGGEIAPVLDRVVAGLQGRTNEEETP